MGPGSRGPGPGWAFTPPRSSTRWRSTARTGGWSFSGRRAGLPTRPQRRITSRPRTPVVPHGVSPKLRPMGAEELADARIRLGLPERFILFVGTIEPRKNLDTLLDAWATMRDRPDLVVVGSWGWRYEAIREKMVRLGPKLHHLESVDPAELPAIYNLPRRLAPPAWYEGFGLPPLEAMACGTPVVGADTSSLPEVVQDAGLVVPAGEP